MTETETIEAETTQKSSRALAAFAIAVAALIAGVIFFVALRGDDPKLSQQEVAARSQIQWEGGARLSVFMNPDATPQQVSDVGAELGKRSDVSSFRYLDKPAAYAEAQQLFKGDDKVLDDLSVESMPTSYRIVPVSEESITVLGDQFRSLPGVRTVTYAVDAQARANEAK
jgi:cell division protein FtsX